jgi:tetratricopeptide (TPR) repeat protein
MIKKTILYILISLLSSNLYGQEEMSAGFKMLEKGNFSDAYLFFGEYLKKMPNDETAQLCFGRAMGLKGDKKESLLYFEKLVKKYPQNFEMKLNYAESFLWNNELENAKAYYQILLNEKSNNFVANLGMANTCSNLKEYPDALKYINKAIGIDPNNEGAKTSKKYILMGYGFQLGQQNQYAQAESILKEGLQLFPNDQDFILTMSNVYFVSKEHNKNEEIVKTLPASKENDLLKNILFSLIYHNKNKDKMSLEFARNAFLSKENTKNIDLKKNIDMRFIQALIWNKKYSQAAANIYFFENKFPDAPEINALKSMLSMYTSNLKQAKQIYIEMLAKDEKSFDGNLGLANAYFGLNDLKNADLQAKKAQAFYPYQMDIYYFSKKVESNLSPEVDLKTSYSLDLGDDQAIDTRLKLKMPISYKTILEGKFANRNTQNNITSSKAFENILDLGISYQLNPKINLSFGVRYLGIGFDSITKDHLMGNTKVIFKPNAFHNIEAGFMQELQDYNTSLIKNNLRTDHYILNYNLSTITPLGFFGQFYYTNLSDSNNRKLLYMSLYYNVLKINTLKFGVNYQHIDFKKSIPERYFSPRYFNLVEGFGQFMLADKVEMKNQFLCNLNVAVGQQFIENKAAQLAYRFQAECGAKLNFQWNLAIYGVYNNIASATAAGGFRYQEIGIKIKYNFGKRIFKNKN